MTPDSWQLATILVGGVATIAIYSFLIKENSLYRFFEHLFIGIAAGYGPVYAIRTNLWPRILEPMLGLDIMHFPDGTVSHSYNPLLMLYLVPMLFGMLYYFIYSRRFSWLAKLVIGFSLGASAGLTFKGFFAEIIPQIVTSFRPLVVFEGENLLGMESFSNTVFIVTLLSVMYYFFFSFRVSGKVDKGISFTGRWLMMTCFGAYFGSTVMARMALLVERLEFLIIDWWGALGGIINSTVA
ncbi:MAG: hypothetical protein J5J00_07255 [Deltaproteobacteria bacterium]|nr:hypothetical protein [Deltaproteobacteria bacterium]